MTEDRLSAERVREVMHHCLLNDDEFKRDPDTNDVEPLVPTIDARSVMVHFGLHRKRLEESKPAIKEMLDELPAPFHKNGGGGWSFLNACVDQHGRQWGEHRTIDELLALGVAAGYVTWCLPRDLWHTFPGGVPYFMIDTGKEFPKKRIELHLGQFVAALQDLDPSGAKVKKGMRGVVQAPADHHGDGAGPLVKWEHGGMCNVYEGDVEVLDGCVENVEAP